jgi:general secretion pathway protein L
MALLVIHLPPRPRLHPGRSEVTPSEAGTSVAEVDFVYSGDGLQPDEQGRSAPSLLPGLRHSTTEVVAVLGEAALSWHRLTLPKAPAARLRAALGSQIEDMVLDEPHALHLAVQPGARAGEPCWIAATDRPWLAGQLHALEESGVDVDRVVPLAAPQTPGSAYLESLDESIDSFAHTTAADFSLSLTWAHPDGVLQLPLVGSAPQDLLPTPLPDGTQLAASPAAAMAAERWFGEPVTIVDAADRWLAAARGDWNLRQFEFAPRHRGSTALRQAWGTFNGAGWRPVRWGLAGVVALQLVGLNTWAWHQKSEVQQRRDEMVSLLRTAHPQVRAVLDAPLQMQRETDALRAAAGRPGDSDLERLLQAVASAWPPDVPVQTLRFEPGTLSLGVGHLAPPQRQAVAGALKAAGWGAELDDRQLTLRPGRAGR